MLKLEDVLRRLAARLSSHSKNISHQAYYNSMSDMVRCYGNQNGTIVIHPTGDTEIADGKYKNNTTLKLAVIPHTITKVGTEAFFNCLALEKVILPHGVTSIEEGAFGECYKLSTIALPDTIEEIGKVAFFRDGVKKVIFGENSKLHTIEDEAFAECEDLEAITLPNSLRMFGSNVFSLCDNLTSATIPTIAGGFIRTSTVQNLTVTSGDIDQKLFYSSDSLKSVTIGNGVRSIGYMAFASCKNLESVTIGNGVTNTGSSAFYNCSKLTSVTISDGVKIIGDASFKKCSSLTSIAIPESVQQIAYDAFSQCDNLTDIHVAWSEGEVEGAPWGATNATVHYYQSSQFTIKYSKRLINSWTGEYEDLGENEVVCSFIPGMTWQEWIDSPYNTVGAGGVPVGSGIHIKGFLCLCEIPSITVNKAQKIIGGVVYRQTNGQVG